MWFINGVLSTRSSHTFVWGEGFSFYFYCFYAGDIFCPLKLGRFPKIQMISGFTFLVGISDLHNVSKSHAHTQENTKLIKLKYVICVPLTGLKGIEKIKIFRFLCRFSKHSYHPIPCFPLFGPAQNFETLNHIEKRFVKTKRKGLEQRKDV